MKKQIFILLIITISILVSIAEVPVNTRHEKQGVTLADSSFDVVYIKYEPPAEYNKMKPVNGIQPDWAKTSEIIEDFHLYTFAELTNCFTTAYIAQIGMTEESFKKMQKEKLEGKYDSIPRISERYLISEFYLTNTSHEYLIVKFDETAAWTRYHGKPAGTVMSKIYEKVDGSWKDITCDTSSLDWYNAIPYESEKFMALFE